MDLSLNEEQIMIQSMARKFASSELMPIADKLDMGEAQETFVKNLKKLAELGFMGLNISSEYGGTNAGTVSFSLAITEIAKACASTAVTTSVTNMVAEVIQAVGSTQQKHSYLPKLCSGEYSAGAFCLTESQAGSDPSSMKCSATKTASGWALNGSKQFITSAEYAGVFVVWALTDKSAAKGKGISCFLVEAGTPGLIIGKPEQKMGQKASSTCQLSFDNCNIDDSALLGDLNKGYRVAVGELAGGRIGVGSLALGIAQAAIDYATLYTKEREQFGKAIANFQGIQWMLADTYTELEAARLLLMSAAYTKDSGAPFSKQASMAKLFSTEAANKACYTALQLLGGNGYIKDYPIERLTRDARVTTIYEGSSEIQRIIIAKQILSEA
jgi:alkylation response protein AidB-like acyl-CoA dehydrogenase